MYSPWYKSTVNVYICTTMHVVFDGTVQWWMNNACDCCVDFVSHVAWLNEYKPCSHRKKPCHCQVFQHVVTSNYKHNFTVHLCSGVGVNRTDILAY